MSKEEIIQAIRSNLSAIKGMGVNEIAIFGSVVRGEAREDSDLDVLVDFNKKTFDAYMDLKEYLELLTGKKIDLIIKSALKPALRQRILAEAIHVTGL